MFNAQYTSFLEQNEELGVLARELKEILYGTTEA